MSAKIVPFVAKAPTPEHGKPRRVITAKSIFAQDCQHNEGYVLHEGENKVACAVCEKTLDPFWVFEEMMKKENRYNELIRKYQKHDAIYRKHSRFKCEHCDKMSHTVKGMIR